MLLSFKAGTNLFMKGSVNNLVRVNVATGFCDDKIQGKTAKSLDRSQKRTRKDSISCGFAALILQPFGF